MRYPLYKPSLFFQVKILSGILWLFSSTAGQVAQEISLSDLTNGSTDIVQSRVLSITSSATRNNARIYSQIKLAVILSLSKDSAA